MEEIADAVFRKSEKCVRSQPVWSSAAPPQHIAERLRLSGKTQFVNPRPRLCLGASLPVDTRHSLPSYFVRF